MYKYFKNIAEKNSCQSAGACMLHPSVQALYDILLLQIREISFYLVKLKEFGITNKMAMAESVEALSIFLINTSFNNEKYLNLIKRLYFLKIKIKEKYLDYCKTREFPCEIINTNLEISDKTTISQLIEYAQNKQKNPDIIKQRLFELITICAKLCAVNVVKIKKLDNSIDEFDFEILRFFALTNGYSIRNEKIKRRINEFSSISLKIKEKLYSLQEEKYGKKESACISTAAKKGHSILISGDDIDELENLLKTLEKNYSEEEINVYTNGALFLAHFFPNFKNNKFLKGHWGTDNAQYDFSVFPGAILITQNFIQKIDTLYKGEIFSNKLISFERVFDIKNNDYTPVIESALALGGFNQDENESEICVNYDLDNINQILSDFKDDKIVIVTEKSQVDKFLDEHKNRKIINLNCPLEMDLLIKIVEKLKEKNVKITIFFSQCNLDSLNEVLSLLNQNIEICLADCSYVLINPHVLEALKLDFGVKII